MFALWCMDSREPLPLPFGMYQGLKAHYEQRDAASAFAG